MTATITPNTIFDVRCDQCGFSESFRNAKAADDAADVHDAEHTLSRKWGTELGGLVLDSHGDGVPFFSISTKAEEYAIEHGLSYIEWNGYVHRVGNVDFRNPVCRASDVPGLTK